MKQFRLPTKGESPTTSISVDYLLQQSAPQPPVKHARPMSGVAKTISSIAAEYLPRQSAPPAVVNDALPVAEANPQTVEARAAAGIGQMFGLDPRVAVLAIILDLMLFAGEIVSVGLTVVFSVIAGGVFGFITYKAQRNWYRDDHDSSLIKALIMGLLTAIPSPLPGFLCGPAGAVGLIHQIRRKKK